MKEKKYLLTPVLFLILIFFLDKIFLIPFFQKDFVQEGNSIFYKHRKDLFAKLQKDPSLGKKKLAVVLGDSRSYPHSMLGITDPKLKSEWILYNFSGPQSVPAYAYYCLSRLLELGIKPDLVVYSISPESFDERKNFFYNPFLKMMADQKFLETFWEEFSFETKENLFWDRVFIFRSLSIDLKVFWNRLTAGKLKQYNKNYNEDYAILSFGNGEFVGYNNLINSKEFLEKDSKRIAEIYVKNFQYSPLQEMFFRKFFDLSKQNSLQVLLVKPKVYPFYEKYLEESGIQRQFGILADEVKSIYKISTLDFSDDSCEYFNDASHQSVICFPPQTEKILKTASE